MRGPRLHPSVDVSFSFFTGETLSMKMNRSLLRVEELERRENPAAIGVGDALAPEVAQTVVPLPPRSPGLIGIQRNGPDIVVGASGTGSSLVRTFSESGTQRLSFNAFESTFTGGITVATMDFNSDGFKDILVGAGFGGGPRVSAFDGVTGQELFSFFAFDPNFAGGISIAVGIFNYGTRPDIIVGTLTGSSHVKVFDGHTRAEIASFFAFDGFTGGVNVATTLAPGSSSDSNIIVGTQSESSHVKVFNGGDHSELSSFLAFDVSYKGGVSVASGDLKYDLFSDIIVGSLRNANHVKVFDGKDNSELASFIAYDSTSDSAGVSVATITAGTGKITFDIGVGSRVGSRLKVFRFDGLTEVKSFTAFGSENPGRISIASQYEISSHLVPRVPIIE
jgi:fibronectin-binding autotransporter adhesin